MATPGIEIQLELTTGAQQVARVELEEALSEGVVARVEVAAESDAPLEDAVGHDAELVIMRDGDAVRRWPLYVTRVRFAGIHGGLLRHQIELRDRLWRLELAKSTRKFRNLSVESIVDAVLAEHMLEARWDLRRPTTPRKYTVQYRESSRHFVSRLLEHEGIYFGVGVDGALEAHDHSPEAPFVAGAASVPLIEAADALAWAAEGVHEVRRGARLAPGAVTLNDYDWKRPALDQHATATAARDADLEHYHYPAGYRHPATGQRLARIRLEAARALSSWCEGRGNVLAFAPGLSFALTGAGPFERDYLLTRVVHRAEVPALLGHELEGTTVYDQRFVAIPRDVPFRPALTHERPSVDGHHTAMVRGPAGEEIHTDRHGRFKGQFHWDREATGSDEDSRWLRVLQECASSMGLARVGWEMSVAYIDGDPERPLGIARQINGVAAAAYAQPLNKTMMAMKTPSSPATGGYSELRLDDRAGAMRFDLRAEKDLVATVKHDRTEHVGHDELCVVGDSSTRNVGGDQTITVGVDATTVVNADDALNVEQNRDKSVGGSEKVAIGTTDGEATTGNDTERVGSLRLTVAGGVGAPTAAQLKSRLVPSPKAAAAAVAVGAAKGAAGGAGAAAGAGGAAAGMVPSMPTAGDVAAMILKGSIQRSAKTNVTRTVGGAMISATLGPMTEKAKLAWAETVGGAKITAAGGDITTGAGKGLITTVGGAIIRSSVGDMGNSSKLARIQVGGVATLKAGAATTVKAAVIDVSAAASLALDGGAVGIQLAPGKVTIKGDMKLDAGASIKITGNPDNVTKA